MLTELNTDPEKMVFSAKEQLVNKDKEQKGTHYRACQEEALTNLTAASPEITVVHRNDRIVLWLVLTCF